MAKQLLHLIVNPTASTTSSRYQNLLVSRLKEQHYLEVHQTEYHGHAGELSKEISQAGSASALLVLGGDGTVNQAAGSLVDGPLPLLALPGGSTSVFARSLGCPLALDDSVEWALCLLDSWQTKTIDVGYLNDSPFLFAAGCGLDAQVTKQVDSQPALKASLRAGFFTWSAFHNLLVHYSDQSENIKLETNNKQYSGSTLILQNGPMYSYWGSKPLVVNPEVDYCSGTLGGLLVHGLGPVAVAELLWKAATGIDSIFDSPHVTVLPASKSIDLDNLQPMPVQADGDYLGEQQTIKLICKPSCLRIFGD